MTYDRLPFDKKIADHVLSVCDLFIGLSKGNNNNLTTKQLKIYRKFFYDKYYNDQVELLEVSEN